MRSDYRKARWLVLLALPLLLGGCKRQAEPSEDHPLKLLAELKVGSKPVRAVAFGYRSDYLAAGGDDKRLVIWSVPSGKEILKVNLDYVIRGLAINTDQTQVAVVGDTWQVDIRSTTSGKLDKQLKGGIAKLTAVTYSFADERLAAGGVEFIIREWKTWSGKLTKTYRGLSGAPNVLEFNKEGTLLVSSGEDRITRVWDCSTAKKLLELPTELDRTVQIGRIFSYDEHRLMLPGRGDSLVIVDPESGQEYRRVRHELPLSAVTASPTENVAATAGGGSIRFWNMDNGNELGRISLGDEKVRCLLYSPDGKMVAVGLESGKVQLWPAPQYGEQTKGAQK